MGIAASGGLSHYRALRSGEANHVRTHARGDLAQMTVPNTFRSIFWFTLPGALCFVYAVGWFLEEVMK